MPVDIPVCPLLFLLPPPVTEAPHQKSGCCWRETGPCSCNSRYWAAEWSLTAFTLHLLSQEWSPLVLPKTRSLQCHSGAGTHLEGFSTSSASKFISTPLWWCARSHCPGSLDRHKFSKFSLGCGYLPSFALYRFPFPSDHGKWEWGRLSSSLGSAATTKVLSSHFQMHRWVETSLASWCNVQRYLGLVMDVYLAVNQRGEKKLVTHSAIMLTSLSISFYAQSLAVKIELRERNRTLPSPLQSHYNAHFYSLPSEVTIISLLSLYISFSYVATFVMWWWCIYHFVSGIFCSTCICPFIYLWTFG